VSIFLLRTDVKWFLQFELNRSFTSNIFHQKCFSVSYSPPSMGSSEKNNGCRYPSIYSIRIMLCLQEVLVITQLRQLCSSARHIRQGSEYFSEVSPRIIQFGKLIWEIKPPYFRQTHRIFPQGLRFCVFAYRTSKCGRSYSIITTDFQAESREYMS
jgi:hypothetical protein